MASDLDSRFMHMELSDSPRLDVFHIFPGLPRELRLQIWEIVVPRQRLIHISLKVHEGRRYELAAAEPRYSARNHLGKPISGERYRAVTVGDVLNSKFLRVNSEAREVVLAFYRVQIPLYLTGEDLTEKTTLMFNPEHDILHIQAEAPVNETLIDFLWDLKAYDPKDVGLLNLAVDLDSFCANDLQYLKKSDIVLIRQRAALVGTLSQLRSVWFVDNFINQYNPPRIIRASHIAGAPSMTIQRFGRDPRPGIEPSLQQLYLGHIDPRELPFRWRRLLRTWQIEHAEGHVVDYRVVMLCRPAIKVLLDPYVPSYGMPYEPRPVPVVGFWLFPLEAFGEGGDGEKLADCDFWPRRRADVTGHWPELVVARMRWRD